MPDRTLIDVNTRTVIVKVKAEELKQRLITEALDAEGMLTPSGQPQEGVTAKCTRRDDTFTVEIVHDRNAQKRIGQG